MKIRKEELQQALSIVKPGLAGKELIEQTTSFAFIGGCVITYNDEISIQHPVPSLKDLTGAVYADELYKILSKLKGDEIELSFSDSEILLESGRTKAGMTLQTEIKLPLTQEIKEKGKWFSLPTKFTEYLQFAISSCSKDQSQLILTCIHVDESGIVEASDGYRLTRCTLGEEMPVETFLLPASSAVEVIRINPTEISYGKGWIHFKTPENTILSCRIVEDVYPNTTHLLKVEGERLILPSSLGEALDRANVFAKREHTIQETVEIELLKNRLKVGSRSETGWFEEQLNIKYDRPSISFLITPYLLKGVLNETDGCIYNETRLKFEGEGWVYITMLKEKAKR